MNYKCPPLTGSSFPTAGGYTIAAQTALSNADQMMQKQNESNRWLYAKIDEVKVKVNQTKVVNFAHEQYRDKIAIGRMIMFVYNPKTRDKLPYYDKYPLVIPIGPAKGGFYGLNFHYLPITVRAYFFDRYMEYGKQVKRYPKQRRVFVTYQMLKGVTALRFFRPCLKHYLFTHVRSFYEVVPYTQWRKALFLPTAKWHGAHQQIVWRDSMKSIISGS